MCIAAGYIATQAKSYEFVIVFLQHGFESFRNRSLKISGGGGGVVPKWHGKKCDPPESTCEMLRPPPSIGSQNIRTPTIISSLLHFLQLWPLRITPPPRITFDKLQLPPQKKITTPVFDDQSLSSKPVVFTPPPVFMKGAGPEGFS